MKKITSRLALALSFISFLFYLIPDDSAEASSAPPISDVTILGPGTWDRDGVGEVGKAWIAPKNRLIH